MDCADTHHVAFEWYRRSDHCSLASGHESLRRSHRLATGNGPRRRSPCDHADRRTGTRLGAPQSVDSRRRLDPVEYQRGLRARRTEGVLSRSDDREGLVRRTSHSTHDRGTGWLRDQGGGRADRDEGGPAFRDVGPAPRSPSTTEGWPARWVIPGRIPGAIVPPRTHPISSYPSFTPASPGRTASTPPRIPPRTTPSALRGGD